MMAHEIVGAGAGIEEWQGARADARGRLLDPHIARGLFVECLEAQEMQREIELV